MARILRRQLMSLLRPACLPDSLPGLLLTGLLSASSPS